MEGFSKDTGFRLLGLLVGAVVLVVLLSSPSMLFASNVSFIDTELSYASSDSNPIISRMVVGDSEWFSSFPCNVSGWTCREYDATAVEARLDADVLLLRRYVDPNSGFPVFFCITHSANMSSFHPPPLCYGVAGYEVVSESTKNIEISDVSWADAPFYSGWENHSDRYLSSGESISMKRLDLQKVVEDKVVENKVVLYLYVKQYEGNNDEVTLIRVSAVAPTEARMDETLSACKNFSSVVVPLLFEVQESEPSIAASLLNAGLGGWSVLLVCIVSPFLVGLIPNIRKKNR